MVQIWGKSYWYSAIPTKLYHFNTILIELHHLGVILTLILITIDVITNLGLTGISVRGILVIEYKSLSDKF